MSKKKKKFCPYCQTKQRTIERLESQLRSYEIKRAQRIIDRLESQLLAYEAKRNRRI